MLKKLYATALVIRRSLLTARRGARPAGPAAAEDGGCIVVLPKDVSFHPADLSGAVGKDGKLALFFPECRALAAPFVLFRLKRQGYSGCRATATHDGLIVVASR